MGLVIVDVCFGGYMGVVDIVVVGEGLFWNICVIVFILLLFWKSGRD